VRDVTRRVAAEEALRVSEARWRSLVENAADYVYMVDPDLRITFLNRDAPGRPREGIVGERVTTWSPPEEHEATRAAYARVFGRGEVVTNTARATTFDGEMRHYETRISPVWQDGKVVAATVVSRDVSERAKLVEAEAAVRSEKRLAETVLDAQAALGEAIALVDDRGRLVHINDALLTLTGYARDELLALPNPVAAVTAPEAADVWAARFAALARGEEVAPRFESWIRRRDGTILPVEIVGTTVVYQERRCRLYILRDLTTQRAAQRELEAARAALAQAEKLAALGTLVSGVAHEARTPMTAMMNASHLLQARAAGGQIDPALAPLLETVVESAARLNGFLEDLRRFTRKGVDARAPLSLDAPVGDALRLLAQTHPAARRVDARLRPTPPTLANAARVAQVVINLVQNAFDASPSGTPVRVVTGEAPEGGALLVVEDEGVGMDEEVQRRMFDALFTTKPDGTGLGLAIVRRILDEHRARIEVESAPGKGTRVRVVFPPLSSP
jgi:PAS domain S-box-containing protein